MQEHSGQVTGTIPVLILWSPRIRNSDHAYHIMDDPRQNPNDSAEANNKARYTLPTGAIIIVKDGDEVGAGTSW